MCPTWPTIIKMSTNHKTFWRPNSIYHYPRRQQLRLCFKFILTSSSSSSKLNKRLQNKASYWLKRVEEMFANPNEFFTDVHCIQKTDPVPWFSAAMCLKANSETSWERVGMKYERDYSNHNTVSIVLIS